MFASSSGPRSASRRRGIVLVLVLGMLGLMALIGVTFATFAGQSLKNGRNFSQGIARPQAEALMDYALAQLINDTNNPLSAIRGHSLLRDMYGNDSVFRGANPPSNSIAETKGLLSSVYDNGSYSTLHFTGGAVGRVNEAPPATPFYNNLYYVTNIPTTGQYQGYDFTRWIIRFAASTVPQAAQTFEVLEDDFSGPYHKFTLSANLGNATPDPSYSQYETTGTHGSSSDWTSFIYNDANLGAAETGSNVAKPFTNLTQELNTTVAGHVGTLNGGNNIFSNAFVLDGRYMRAFNGPGLTRPYLAPQSQDANSNPITNFNYPYNVAAFGNMRIAHMNPDAIGMDEDYDACDLENWFLAIQSADGQVMIPSFHRPGILTALDWTDPTFNIHGNEINNATRAKILRPRQADNSPLFPPDPSVLDSNGKLTYDIDNDGDGVTDSVWLDLGYPVQRDPNGKLYKPLFAFMVLGLNGRLPLNTVGNLQARAIGDPKNNTTTSPPVLYPTSSGQVPYPGIYTSEATNNRYPHLSSQVYFDWPLYDHASHLGYSVNEINPKFALQNAPTNLYSGSAYGVYTDTSNQFPYTQYDDVGVSVALTQMRNILAGTVPPDPANGDKNFVYVAGQPYFLPNSMADGDDHYLIPNIVSRSVTTVPGRWGEPEGIPPTLPTLASFGGNYADPTYPTLYYNNPVRAGRSYFTGGSVDAMDDDFDAFDPYLPNVSQNASNTFNLIQNGPPPPNDNYTIPLNSTTYAGSSFQRSTPEEVDGFDNIGQRAIASERSRLYVTPQDPVGVGRSVAFMTRPGSDHDYGTGADNRGRVGFFRYFRPAGMPQEVRYPYVDSGSGANAPSFFEGINPNTSTKFANPYVTNSGTGQRYLMPVLLPAGRSSNNSTTSDDVSNNLLHGLQAAMTPQLPTPVAPFTAAQMIAPFAAMPFDYDSRMGQYPPIAGYGSTINLQSPVINPTGPNANRVNTNDGPYGSPGIVPFQTQVINGYRLGSLNKNEADEMNLYTTNTHDMPYGPSDLEWLYRKHDVDGSTLNSRLSQLAPVSFTNPADGLTRRRLFSTDSWELNSIVYANDNPIPYAGVLGGQGTTSTDHDFTFNSRFLPNASPSLEIMNQVVATSAIPAAQTSPFANQVTSAFSAAFANPITTEFLPNPTLPIHAGGISTIQKYPPNSAYVPPGTLTPYQMPQPLDPANTTSIFGTHAFPNAQVNQYTNVIIPLGDTVNSHPASAAQVQTPPIAHRDRKINLNFPLPISNDPAEPVRQKWCRETYQMLKAILPPASVDTPEELAALSQFVVNIIDFRDTDCTMTRFVNTDLEVTDVLTKQTAPATNPATLDTTYNVSPMGVKFSRIALPLIDPLNLSSPSHFPYDPSLYNPDAISPFLVQHGMEYNPIAINEALAIQSRSGTGTATGSTSTTYQALFFELVNTLSESQNNSGSTNSSAISLAGWDMIIAPDNYGWGRPDPISGDISPIAYPPSNLGGPTPTDPPALSQRPAATAGTPLNAVQRIEFGSQSSNTIKVATGTTPEYFVVGTYSAGATTTNPDGSTTNNVEINPIVTGTIDALIDPTNPGATNYALAPRNNADKGQPSALANLPQPGTGTGLYYWVYLRRPANPFDTDALTVARPNREMVVVDAMRFPYIDSGNFTTTGTPPSVGQGGKDAKGNALPDTRAPNIPYSSQRLQPYRGGHLLPVATTAGAAPASASPAAGTTKICPPSPAYAYGYSEQMAIPALGTTTGKFTPAIVPPATTAVPVPATKPYNETIGAANSPFDTNWSHIPFHDRDFASVAELLLVPRCPPGLFTKQFVEEPYPGNYTGMGVDNNSFTMNAIVNPAAPNAGRPNFNANPLPAVPTFPYLTDNFYYTAASVAPPPAGSVDSGYTKLTTEIGGWTGAGWHKMFEFFEVPSSANGAIGTADGGNNYDWYRADLRPGQLNVNLIMDDEVFAGLIDDPRLNDNLAAQKFGNNITTIPYVVSQVDANGYPVHDNSGKIQGRYPIFATPSFNIGTGYSPNADSFGPVGRGYAYRDPDVGHYLGGVANPTPFQQVSGLKAAFSDFLKLRHGGSGYLFAHGAGQVGSGDFTRGPFTLPLPASTQPIAADRPYRALSYPDINYTIMRPASLPPTQLTSPVLPANLTSPVRLHPGYRSTLRPVQPTAGADECQSRLSVRPGPGDQEPVPARAIRQPDVTKRHTQQAASPAV